MSMIAKNDSSFYVNGHRFLPHFGHYTSADMYEKVKLKGYAPMTAKR